MQNPLFLQWFEYDLYANSKVLHIIENHVGHLPDDTLKLFSHILAAHHIWNARLMNQPTQLKVWERIPVSEMGLWLRKNFENSKLILEKQDNQAETNYKTSDGRDFKNSTEDICFHLLTHSHYHRGQIARNMRENNIEPAETNYIVYKR